MIFDLCRRLPGEITCSPGTRCRRVAVAEFTKATSHPEGFAIAPRETIGVVSGGFRRNRLIVAARTE